MTKTQWLLLIITIISIVLVILFIFKDVEPVKGFVGSFYTDPIQFFQTLPETFTNTTQYIQKSALALPLVGGLASAGTAAVVSAVGRKVRNFQTEQITTLGGRASELEQTVHQQTLKI